MRKLPLLLLALAATGCASASLNEGGKKVRFVTTTPHTCEYLGEVTGHFKDYGSFGIVGDTEGMAQIALKNNAAAMGADTVEMTHSGTREASGEAYRCGRAPAAN